MNLNLLGSLKGYMTVQNDIRAAPGQKGSINRQTNTHCSFPKQVNYICIVDNTERPILGPIP